MPTNNETIKKLEKRLHDEFLVPPLLFVQLEALVDKRAKADTAKQIFKELDKIVCKNHKGSATFGIAKNMDVIHVEDYEALKKKHNIED